ncbi:MAG: single-stranded DNA-binding protein [Candidatus Harrisonbacteria bacterium]|nr:single-stranded DNA-binding protein [Candidatus Harrisonbacteria bacterium]
MNLNKVLLIGRLTADPQLRSTKSGSSVAVFSLATNRVWTDKQGQKQDETEFHNIVVWGKQAETAAKYLLKGQLAMIEGRLQTRQYEDQQGNKRRTTEVVAERVQFGPKAGSGGGSFNQSASSKSAPEPSQESKEEDIPTIDLDDEIKPEDLPF